jgi:hypothetical protein
MIDPIIGPALGLTALFLVSLLVKEFIALETRVESLENQIKELRDHMIDVSRPDLESEPDQWCASKLL